MSTTQLQPTVLQHQFLDSIESSKAKKEKAESGNTNGSGDKNILNYNQENKKRPNLIYKEAAKEGELRSLQLSYEKYRIIYSSTHFSTPCKFLYFCIA